MDFNFKDNKKLIITIIVLFSLICGIIVYVYYKSDNEDNNEVIVEDSTKLVNTNNEEEKKDEKKEESIAEEIILKDVFVDIKGQVKNPGVYKIQDDKRIIDVINMAGGYTTNADTKCVNLSKQIFNEMVIYIHSKDEVIRKIEPIKEKEINKIICDDVVNDGFIKEEDYNKDIETKEDIKEDIKDGVSDTKDEITDTKDETTKEENNTNDLVNINTADKESLTTLPGIGDSKALDIIAYRKDVGLFKSIEELQEISGIGEATFEKLKNLISI